MLAISTIANGGAQLPTQHSEHHSPNATLLSLNPYPFLISARSKSRNQKTEGWNKSSISN